MTWESALQIDKIETLRLTESRFLSTTGLGILRIFLLLGDIWVITLTGILQRPATYFVFATNWSAVLNLWYLFIVTILTWRKILGRNSETDSKYIKVAYLSQETALPISLMVVALYWTVINPSANFADAINGVSSIQNHAGSCALILTDFIFSEMQFIPVHIFGDVFFFVAYLPVNAAYSLTTEPVYEVMTWHSWKTLVLIVASCVAIGLFYLVLWGISRLKTKNVDNSVVNDLRMVAIQYEKQAAEPV